MKLVMKTLILMKYGGGTWVQDSAGMVTVSKDSTQTEFNTLGKTGGEKKHTLTTDEMPSHNHSGSGDYFLRSAASGGVTRAGACNSQPQADWKWYEAVTEGSNQPHNNLQPYIVTVRWHRTA